MRLRNLILGDIRFQYKYGFYFVYIILTIIYICLLNLIPSVWRVNGAAIMIYSDPAAMGLFYMGAIVLLEKSQRVINSLAVSPVKISEYILSKVLSLGVISTFVGLFIATSIHMEHLILVGIGTFLGSVLFSLLGLILAANIISLNQFILATVPVEIICFVPPIAYLIGYQNYFLLFHPGTIIIRMINGETTYFIPLLFLLFVWILILYYVTYQVIKIMFQRVGGVKL
jgi:fluoroquinolone transport system permease protein